MQKKITCIIFLASCFTVAIAQKKNNASKTYPDSIAPVGIVAALFRYSPA